MTERRPRALPVESPRSGERRPAGSARGVTLCSGSGPGNLAHSRPGGCGRSGVREGDGEAQKSLAASASRARRIIFERAQSARGADRERSSRWAMPALSARRATARTTTPSAIKAASWSTCSSGDASCQRELIWRPSRSARRTPWEQMRGELGARAGREATLRSQAHTSRSPIDPARSGPRDRRGLSAAEGSGRRRSLLIDGQSARLDERRRRRPRDAAGRRRLRARSLHARRPAAVGDFQLEPARRRHIVELTLVSAELGGRGLRAQRLTGYKSKDDKVESVEWAPVSLTQAHAS